MHALAPCKFEKKSHFDQKIQIEMCIKILVTEFNWEPKDDGLGVVILFGFSLLFSHP